MLKFYLEIIRNNTLRVEETAHRLRVLAAITEDLSTNMMTHNLLQTQFLEDFSF